MSRAETRGIPTDVLRDALSQALDGASFRAISRESGVSPMGLHRLLAGAEPQQQTRRKLESWYIRRVSQSSGTVTAELAAAALHALALGLPASRRDEAIQNVLDAWASEYSAVKIPPPDWLTALKRTTR